MTRSTLFRKYVRRFCNFGNEYALVFNTYRQQLKEVNQ